MSEPETGDWVTIIHPETGGTGTVHRSSLHQHYAAGWRLLAGDEVPQPEPALEPPPMTKAQAAKAEKAASAETKEN
jgi:hypothetical protein